MQLTEDIKKRFGKPIERISKNRREDEAAASKMKRVKEGLDKYMYEKEMKEINNEWGHLE